MRKRLRVQRGLYVRNPFESASTPSGLVRPKVYVGSNRNAFWDRRVLLLQGRDIVKERGILFVENVRDPDYEHVSEQWAAGDHAEACRALDRTPAGRKATELLFSILTPVQRHDAERYHRFEVCFPNPYRIEDDLKYEHPSVDFNVGRFMFCRGFPNGNIHFKIEGASLWQYTVCMHPIQPYPTDDIVLSQYMMLISDPDGFLSQGNVTYYGTHNRVSFSGMFARTPQRQRLILP